MKKLGLLTLGAMLLVGMLLAPACAVAAEWNMYGSARLEYFYNSYDKEVAADNWGTGTAVGDGVSDDTDMTFGVQGNARIGANVKATDQVSGRFEYGAGPNLRLLYGDYNFGSGTLRVGQDYTPMSGATSGQVVDVDDNLNSVGAVDGPRQAQIKLLMGGFSVALVQNYGVNYGSSDIPALGAYSTTDILIPKIEASYEFKTDMMSIMPFVGYQTYDIETAGVTQTSESITSYVLGVHGRFSFGPAYVNVSGHWAQNAGNYGLFEKGAVSNTATTVTQSSPALASQANLVGTSIEDATTYGCALVVGFTASEMVSIEAGIGYTKSEVDIATGTTLEDDTMAYYVNVPITLAKGVYIIPEIGFYDYGDLEITGVADQTEGQRLYYGAKFQIDF